MSKIKLAGQEFELQAPAFGKLKKVISSINKLQNLSRESSGLSEAAMDEIAVVLSLMTGKTLEEIESMPIGIKEMTDAMSVVPAVCGLEEVEVKSGEAQA